MCVQEMYLLQNNVICESFTNHDWEQDSAYVLNKIRGGWKKRIIWGCYFFFLSFMCEG